MNSKLSPDVQAAGKAPGPSWSGLVERIHAGDPSAMEELYTVFAKGVRFYLWRQLGPQDLDDKVHDIFLIITQSIQKGEAWSGVTDVRRKPLPAGDRWFPHRGRQRGRHMRSSADERVAPGRARPDVSLEVGLGARGKLAEVGLQRRHRVLLERGAAVHRTQGDAELLGLGSLTDGHQDGRRLGHVAGISPFRLLAGAVCARPCATCSTMHVCMQRDWRRAWRGEGEW